jgi:hypothetical protein
MTRDEIIAAINEEIIAYKLIYGKAPEWLAMNHAMVNQLFRGLDEGHFPRWKNHPIWQRKRLAYGIIEGHPTTD